MDSIEFFQVFIIIIILILTLLYMSFRSYTSSSSSSTSSVAAVDTDIPPLQDSSTDILPLKEKYDVFLGFRGEDTRLGFTSHLHKALLGKKIETYIDDRLARGDEIAPALLEAIARSMISVIIFSEKYASSTWCLKELVHILGCKKRYGQIVLPIFYRIDPSDLRNKKGTYALALDELEKRFKGSTDEVVNWRDALKEAANIAGFHYYSSETGRTEADFVEEVVQDVLTKLKLKSPGDLKDSPGESSSDLKGLVGIQRKIKKIESLLCLDSPGVCCVGIWGMGGIGKTTLADAVFHRQRQSSKFEVCCFLANVRENSENTDALHQLRNKLVGEILKEKQVNIDTPSIPADILIRLRRTKALIVLDDVNARKQLEYLVGDDDRFCQGSRIIITARDKGLLEQKVDHEKIYSVEGLGYDEALKLFHSHAFGNKSPTTDYTELSREVVDYIKGIPLALKVMGSSFRRCKSKQEWEVQWRNPKSVENSCDVFGKAGINDLIDRSLISISKWNHIEMHDLVEEMGKAIAQEQGSRLFMAKGVNQLLANNQGNGHVQAISIVWREMEYANFEKMHQLRWLRYLPTSLIGSLGLPNSLRCLRWFGYPLKSLPSKFSAQNLVVLEIPCSQVEGQLWNEDQSPVNLKWINLRSCMHLTKVPDLSQSLQIEHIDLRCCKSLVEIPSYFQHLGKLIYLDLGWCTNLKNLPEMPCNLEFLDLSRTAIEELPSSVWSHEKISHLDITSCKHLKSLPSNTCKLKPSLSLEGCESLCEFWELPRDTTELALNYGSFPGIKELRNASIESAVGLTLIEVTNCKSLVSLPTNIWKLKSLKSLDLKNCSNFQNFPEISEVMEYLEILNLIGTAVKELPPSIGNLVALRELDLHDCKNLEVVPDELFCLTSLQELNLRGTKIKSIPASIKQAAQLSRMVLNSCESLEYLPELPPSLKAIDLSGCSKFQYFPKILEPMEHLEFLNLTNTAVKELSPSIGNLVALRKLDLGCCENLELVPDELFCLTSLQELILRGTKIKSIPASIKQQAAQLSCLVLINCKSLESLPELPPLLQHLEVEGCTSLKIVSSSSTALAQGWEKYKFSQGLCEQHIFFKCLELDENARSNIMADAQLRIMRMATARSKIEVPLYDSYAKYYHSYDGFYKESFVGIRCCGNEIPNWFSHKSEGCSIKIEFPRDWFSTDFLGFALSLVVVGASSDPRIESNYHFKTSNGESREVTHSLSLDSKNGFASKSFPCDEVFVWCLCGAQRPIAFYKLVTEVNVDFTVWGYDISYFRWEVEKCGICLLYGKDAEMIKQRAL
ncbi:unnamed protein product [Prunus brigantina]